MSVQYRSRAPASCGCAQSFSGASRLTGFSLRRAASRPTSYGYQLIQELRSRPSQQGGAVPAAALTAYARTEDRLRALRAGFQLQLAKPVHPSELITVVSSLAARRA